MVRRDAAFLRNTRLDKIRKKIASEISASKTKKLNVRKLGIWIQLNTGLTSLKAREYIELIAEGMGWTIQNEELITIREETED